MLGTRHISGVQLDLWAGQPDQFGCWGKLAPAEFLDHLNRQDVCLAATHVGVLVPEEGHQLRSGEEPVDGVFFKRVAELLKLYGTRGDLLPRRITFMVLTPEHYRSLQADFLQNLPEWASATS